MPLRTSLTGLNRSQNRHRAGSHKARVNYVADFETTTDPNDLPVRVWAWGLAEIASPDDVEMNNSMESFIDRISMHNSTCYFHNLAFDGSFIIDYIMKHEYKYTTIDGGSEPGTFKMLMSDMGKVFSITVRWLNGHTTEFRDSLKKLPMGVARIATAFNLPEAKGEIDYDAPRPVGHVLTDEEKDYLRRDVSIVAHAMAEVLESGMTKLTVASDALNEYKKLVHKSSFDTLFPVLSDDMDAEIRRAYRGGWAYADERFKGRVLTGGGIVLDVNSLYPSVMKNTYLPYGEPQYQDGKVEPTAERPLVIFSVTITAKLKPDHVPCIQVKGSAIFGETEYLKEIDEPTTIMMTNVDFDLYQQQYDVTVLSYGGGWRFKAAKGMFDTYIDKWSKIKANSKGGKREIAKLHLNSLYGKFATNPQVTGKYPILDGDAVRFVRGPEERRNPVYTAVGVFITSYARDLTIRAAQANYKTFAYADTDSLHLLRLDTPTEIDVHPSRLGAWKFEYAFSRAFYIRPKAYLEQHYDRTYTNRIAGLPEKVSGALTFDSVVDGAIIQGKLNPKRVPGGVILQNVDFKLKL